MFFYRITNDMRITVRPYFLAEQSEPEQGRFVFVYRVRIENVGERTAQLLRRHWHIHDPVGGDIVVDGEGVVGQQPVLAPGDVHEYESFCVLQSASGHMDGFYHFRRTDNSAFDSEIPRFDLSASAAQA